MRTSFLSVFILVLFCLFGQSNTSFAQVNLQISSTNVAPVIDGNIDAVWDSQQGQAIGHVISPVSSDPFPPSDFSANFKTMWDASSIYVLAVVTDDSKINDSNESWQDDALEVYFDIDNNKLTSYGINDYQFTFRWNDPNIYSNNGHIEGVLFIIKGTSTGYILEVKFPWTTLGLASPHPGVLLGYDIQVHDDDDGGARDNKFAWFATVDDSWHNPSLFATARLISNVLSDSIDVTFQVDMRDEAVSTSGVYLTGSFNGWNEAITLEANGKIYSGTLKLKKGETIEYKFINGGLTDWDKYENPEGECTTGNDKNRNLIVPQYDETLALVCFSSCSVCETIYEPELQIGSTTVAPIIDGSPDAIWSTTPKNEITHLLYGSSPIAASFKTLWDSNNLYVLLEVEDAIKINDSGVDKWRDDGAEIYIDINNDKLTTYGNSDYQFSFRWNDLIYGGIQSGVNFSIAGTSNGYILEVKFSWASLGQNPAVNGTLLGFDLQVNNDDNGGDRDNKLGWFATTDNAWNNPSLLATSELVDKVVILYPADKPKISAEKGFYTEPFDVTISSPIQDMNIYYTLDGSDPATSASAQMLLSPAIVRIDPESTQNRGKTPGVVLRARAKKEGYKFSETATRTYLFINKIGIQTAFPGHDWPKSNINNQQIDLLVDNRILNDSRYENMIDDALTEIPSFSVVTDNKNLFDPLDGIYVNSWNARGLDWERPVSVELINPNGTDGFQIDAGLRIRGGWSRNNFFPKHAFRLFFRKEYGEGKLKFPLFEKEGVDEFDKVDLRCAQNYSWSKPDPGEAQYYTFTRDVFSRDVQRAMGDPYTRSRYYHLYLNGLYWGLYQTQERSEANFASSYFGGTDDDYDVIKKADTGGIEATDGNLETWQAVWDLCLLGFTENINYYKLQGLDATGKRDPSLKVMVDIDNLINYMNVIFYTGNFDAPVSSFMQNKGPNNFYAIYNKTDDQGFQFFAHDNEHTLLIDPNSVSSGIYENRVNIGSIDPYMRMEVFSFNNFQPQWLHFKLCQNAEYRMRFADIAYKFYYNNGILTPAKTAQLFRNRSLEIDTAVIAESARWGDVAGGPYTKDDNWVSVVNRTLNEYFPQRTDIVINQLKDEGLLPTVIAPVYKKNNVLIEDAQIEFTPGNTLSIIKQSGTGSIKFTVDGSDPRLIGNGVSPTAVDGGNQTNISILQTTIVKARVFSGGNWSPLHTIKVIIDIQISGLQLTEINYNPLGADGLSGSEYEFIELKNRGTSPINLTASNFIDGIKYSFNNETVINPGNFVVLASSAYSFKLRYGFEPNGEYQGQLDNGGERLTLVGVTGDTLISIKYDDIAPWPTTPDSLGFSLVPAVNSLSADWDDGTNWRASSSIGGSPNADDTNLNILPVFVNEVLSNSDLPAVDAIEIYNPNDVQVSIGGWYLTDKRDSLKWKIPAGTTIPAKSFKVFNEGHYVNTTLSFNSNEFGSAFSLNSHGDEVYIFSANSSGVLTGYENEVNFGEIETGVSIGRHINSIGKEHFVAQAQTTLNQANSYPRVGPVVINQIMYNPTAENFEYLELVNISSGDVKLYEETKMISWKVSGIDFDFPPNTTLAAGESVYLVESGISPEDFRFFNSMAESVKVFNFSGSLKNEGEEITLFKAAPQFTEQSIPKTAYIRIDKVDYNDNSNWPDADGNGNVLLRKTLSVYGNDPASWLAAPPGIKINTLFLPDAIELAFYSKQLLASGGTTPYSWSTTSGSLPPGISLNPLTGFIEGKPAQKGTFNVTIKVEDLSGGSNSVSLSLLVKENTMPVAVNDTVTTNENYSIIANILENDTDYDGDKPSWVISIANAPTYGTANVNNDRTITYFPERGFAGTDKLTYRITDAKGFSNAQLVINVKEVVVIASTESRISQGSDDAEENINSHQFWPASSDLEMTYDPNPGGDQFVGIRFQNVIIPTGATITKAYIEFATKETNNLPANLTFNGELNPNPATFSETNLISSRLKTTASVNWIPQSWDIVNEVSEKQQTPDLKTILNEIISAGGWASGNSMAFFVTGTGTRVAKAYDMFPDAAALLHIEYNSSGAAVIPIANAGVNQDVPFGNIVQLNGNQSVSTDNRNLNFNWSIKTKPAGSTAVLSNLNLENPTFVADKFGTYVINLMVDNGVHDSEVSTVTITVENHQPIANAGTDQIHIEGSLIRLNGNGSSDPDGNPLVYSWNWIDKPAGSSATLSNQTIVNPTFTANVAGTYSLSLIVSDGIISSVADQVVITATTNQLPIANAGSDVEVITGNLVVLDGSKSSDPEGGSITYSWVMVSKPDGSSSTLLSANNKKPSLQADKAGKYVIRLVVSDGKNNSAPDEVVITAVDNLPPVAVAGDDQTINAGQKVLFDGSRSFDPEGNSLTYQWSIVVKPANVPVLIQYTDPAKPSFTPTVSGLYVFKLQVSDGILSSEDLVQITVLQSNDVIATSISNSLKVYPNPFKDKLVVEYNSTISQPVTFSLFNISGSLVKSFEFNSLGHHTQVLDFENDELKYGVYLLVMKPEIGEPKVMKVNYLGR
jgi:hypothetical protein